MKNLKLIILALGISLTTYSQNIGINATGTAPNASAMLDVSSTNKGVLIPRVALTSTSSNSPIGASITTSLLVYNTATVSDVTTGFYYWDGSKWVSLHFGNSGASRPITRVSLTGNQSHTITTADGDIAISSAGNITDTLFLPSAASNKYYEFMIIPAGNPGTNGMWVYRTNGNVISNRCSTSNTRIRLYGNSTTGTCTYHNLRLKSDGVNTWYVVGGGN